MLISLVQEKIYVADINAGLIKRFILAFVCWYKNPKPVDFATNPLDTCAFVRILIHRN